MTEPATTPCPVCAAPASGRFCARCGAALTPRACTRCGAALHAAARFCHRCGQPAQPGAVPAGAAERAVVARERRTPWLVAGIILIVLLAFVALKGINRNNPPAAPVMANPGNAADGGEGTAPPFAGGAGGGAPPDIANMTPVERFNRLYDRIMRAASQGDTVQVRTFAPMGLMAFAQLDTIDADARYHAAMIHAALRDWAGALAEADTLLAQNPDHLFGYLVRGDVARLRGDQRALAAAQRDFAARVEREFARTDRPEYQDHAPVIDQFRKESGK